MIIVFWLFKGLSSFHRSGKTKWWVATGWPRSYPSWFWVI